MNCLHHCQQPLTHPTDSLFFRLFGNDIGPEGAKHLAFALKQNGTLATLKCAPPPLMTAFIIVSSR